MIIPIFVVTVKRYRESFLKLLDISELYCSICGSKVHVHSWYWRWIWAIGEVGKIQIPILRVLCKEKACARTHAVLPQFIAPYRQYEMQVIEKVLERVENRGQQIDMVIQSNSAPPENHATGTLQEQSDEFPVSVCQNRENAVYWIKRFRANENAISGKIRLLLAKLGISVSLLEEPVGSWNKITWFINLLTTVKGIPLFMPRFSFVNQFLATMARKGNDYLLL